MAIRLIAALSFVLMVFAAPSAQSERKEKPGGDEISQKAKSAEFDKSKAVKGEKDGKTINLIPANLDHVQSVDDLENGQVIAVLETEVEAPENGLPPGKYNLFLVTIKGETHVYAESGGRIVTEALVKVVNHTVQERTSSGPVFVVPKGLKTRGDLDRKTRKTSLSGDWSFGYLLCVVDWNGTCMQTVGVYW